MNKFRVEERIGCIAVVLDDFSSPGLAPDLPGVLAYWHGSKDKDGWTVEGWKKVKAHLLCDLLNGFQNRLEPTPEQPKFSPIVRTLKVAGKPFRCPDCGANVFTEYAPQKYLCNGCQSAWEGEKLE